VAKKLTLIGIGVLLGVTALVIMDRLRERQEHSDPDALQDKIEDKLASLEQKASRTNGKALTVPS